MTDTKTQRRRAFFVAPSPRFEFASAERYGRVEFLFSDPSGANALGGRPSVEAIKRELVRREYRPGEDAVGLTGPVACVAMLSIAATELWMETRQVAYHDSDGGVRALVFDARDGGSYRERWLAGGPR